MSFVPVVWSTRSFAIVSAKLEAEISSKSKSEQLEYLSSLGIEMGSNEKLDQVLCHNVLPSMIQALLELSLAYTGPGVPPEVSRTTKSYLFSKGTINALDLAGRLHGEIERGFINAEVASAEVLLKQNCFTAAKESGCIRTEGKNYAMKIF